MHSEEQLKQALRRYWGYESFLPRQQSIVSSLLGAHDTCVVMPTGGGKSLCYQLPAALLSGRTVVVISPLIALMQDQVAQLEQMGIPSAALNSTLSPAEQAEVMRNAAAAHYRLLYLSPERLARPETLGWLRKLPLCFFAIDEAHCISEWGHEFRPDYRQLSLLRQHFPNLPIAAFTASATRQVRHDIIEQLQLREPHKYIASFHRPNLSYFIRQCDAKSQDRLLISALERHSQSSVIVYAPTIARVEKTAGLLESKGFPAAIYHGQMDAAARKANQECWMSDSVQVMVGTIAFGLGINKPSVRAVIHLSLPKSIEQYYQEAGRAGRDGQPADCILLWQKRDAGLLAHFIEQITDAAERERAWRRYHQIRDLAESQLCRPSQICLHFGENPKWESCGSCDACGGLPSWLAGEEPLPFTHRTLAARAQLPPSAKALEPAPQPPMPRFAEATVEIEINPELREYLREWRRTTAQEMGIPAYVVMHDRSLDELCAAQPHSLAEIRAVYGFGERKTESYGPQILQALEQFRAGARASAPPPKLKKSGPHP